MMAVLLLFCIMELCRRAAVLRVCVYQIMYVSATYSNIEQMFSTRLLYKSIMYGII